MKIRSNLDVSKHITGASFASRVQTVSGASGTVEVDATLGSIINISTIAETVLTIVNPIVGVTYTLNITGSLTFENTTYADTVLKADYDGSWNVLIGEAPIDGQQYARKDGGWEAVESVDTSKWEPEKFEKTGYGALYNWYALEDSLSHGGLIDGFSVPDETIWSLLFNYLGLADSKTIKSQRNSSSHIHPRWAFFSNATVGTNSSGLNCLPAGYRDENGAFVGIGEIGTWSSYTSQTTTHGFLEIYHNNSNLYYTVRSKAYGRSIRLFRALQPEELLLDDGTLLKTATDADNNVYNVIKIGSLGWLLENLRTTKYVDGVSIQNITDNVEWGGATSGAFCWYNNNGTADGITYNSNIEQNENIESGTLIRPKDGKKVDASHIEGLEQGGHTILDPAENTMPTQPALQFGTGFTVTNETGKTVIGNTVASHVDGAVEEKHQTNQVYEGSTALSTILPQLVNLADIDMSDIIVGEKKILVAEKGSDGLPQFGGAIGLLDVLAPPTLDTLLDESNPLWIGDYITLTGDNRQGQLGENSQFFEKNGDLFLCKTHNNGTTELNGSATWARNRGQDCLKPESIALHATIVGQLETEDGWNALNQFKQIAAESKRGSWFRRLTGGYLFMCIDDANGWTRVGTPPTIELEITTSSHPNLTASLAAHDFTANRFYVEGTNATDEPAEQGQEWWDTANKYVYRRNMNGNWAKLN